MNSNVKLKTITMFVNNKGNHRIFNYMTKISKNIYNSTIYCATIYMKYKHAIFKEIHNQIKSQISTQSIDKTLIEKLIYDLYELKYNEYTKTNKIINHNNEIIYKFIKSLLHNLYLVNDNYEIIREIIIYSGNSQKCLWCNFPNLHLILYSFPRKSLSTQKSL